MIPERNRPWQIAADLEAAAIAVKDSQLTLAAVHKSAWDQMFDIPGIASFDADADEIASGLRALSAHFQAIADAEPDERAVDELRTGFREEDFA